MMDTVEMEKRQKGRDSLTPDTLAKSNTLTPDEVRQLVAQVEDPEIPVITIEDLGILRDVTLEKSVEKNAQNPQNTKVIINITPTYTACVANDVISADITHVLEAAGFTDIEIRHQFDPPWTTDWITAAGRQKLQECNIALPDKVADKKSAPQSAHPSSPANLAQKLFASSQTICPQCQSPQTELVSQFGSTLCKSSHKCLSCQEPFEAFKCH